MSMEERKAASWVVVDKHTQVGVFEFFNPRLIALVNKEKYDVEPIYTYLCRVNRGIAEQAQ